MAPVDSTYKARRGRRKASTHGEVRLIEYITGLDGEKDREPVTNTCYESVVEGTGGYVDVRFSPTDCGERSYQRVACRLARLWLGWRTTNVLNSFARYFGRAVSVCLCRVCSVLCPPLCAHGGSPRLANVSMRLCTSCRHHVVHMGCQQGGRVDDHAL